MGGHWPYVWGSYGLFALLLAAELLLQRHRHRRTRTVLNRRFRRTGSTRTHQGTGT
ncbi:heme exporter protein CcmD [Thioalkalivibrio denitrificans]|nr:heme exporter protein CcmD [Thioalkalivibrio denitrificans]